MTLPKSLPHIGMLMPGARNTITDVAGVTVGHCTLADDALQTGVTVVRPHAGDLYRDRVPAAADGTEQAILHALWHATSVTGRNGHQRQALRDLASR